VISTRLFDPDRAPSIRLKQLLVKVWLGPADSKIEVRVMWQAVLVVGLLIGSEVLVAPALAGDVQGRILIQRGLTKKRVASPAYHLRGVALPAAEGERRSIDELSRIAVYLEGPQPSTPKPVVVNLTQKNRRFDPELLILPVGSTVSFPNADPIFHNVFSLSKALQFDLGYYPMGQTRTVRLDQVGIIQVYCHLHPDMNAAIIVVPNGWYAQPGPDGNFAFAELPAGTYRVVAWHRSAGFFRQQVSVAGTGTSSVSLSIPLAEGNPAR
jgi:plastocyanin